MTGVARATCDLLRRLEADRPRRHVECGGCCACARRWGGAIGVGGAGMGGNAHLS